MSKKMLPAAGRAALEPAVERYAEALAESPETLEYLAARGIHVDPDMPDGWGNPHRLGLVVDPIPDHENMRGRLAIPYIPPRGGPVGMKFRCLRHADCKAVDCPKYLAHAGMGQRLYGVQAFRVPSPIIAVTEGELDAIVATEAGIPAVACPGVKAWNDAWQYLFEGYEQVLVFGDGDEAGTSFAERLADQITGARAVTMPDKEDVTSLVVKHGVDALRGRFE